MRKHVLWTMLLCMFLSVSSAEGIMLDAPRNGTLYYPEGASGNEAMLVYSYQLPRASGADSCSEGIEAVYNLQEAELINFTVPVLGESLTLPASVQLTFEVTCNDSLFVSFHFITKRIQADQISEIHSAHTFARNGTKEGLIITLPNLLGLLQHQDMNDSWLETRQTERANALIRHLVEQQLVKEGISQLSAEALHDVLNYDFFPEEDFFLDADDNPVFFIQPGLVHPNDPVFIPLTMESILDAL